MMFDAYEDLRREQSVDPSPSMRRQLRRFVFALFCLRINLLLELLARINGKGQDLDKERENFIQVFGGPHIRRMERCY